MRQSELLVAAEVWVSAKACDLHSCVMLIGIKGDGRWLNAQKLGLFHRNRDGHVEILVMYWLLELDCIEVH